MSSFIQSQRPNLVKVYNASIYVSVGAAVLTLLVAFLLYMPLLNLATAGVVSGFGPQTTIGAAVATVGGAAILVKLIVGFLIDVPASRVSTVLF